MAKRQRQEFVEGPEAAWRAEQVLGKILRISKPELERREAAHNEANLQKRKRGPKPKA